MTNQTLIVASVLWVLCAVLAGAIAGQRGASVGGYFFVGLFLGVLGVILACFARGPVAPPQPPGWYADPWQQSQGQIRYWDGYQWTWHVNQPAGGQVQASS